MSSFNVKEHSDDLLIVPLGGTGEIGMNVTMYHVGGKWIIVDLGIGFSGQDLPGTDLVVADVSFAIRHKNDVLCILVTHAHEDHGGAIPYLYHLIGCPVFAPPFAAAFLRAKLAAAKIGPGSIPIHEFSDKNNILHIGGFKLRFIRMTHSVPDTYSIVIEANGMRVFHTGDWKFDDEPLIGKCSDIDGIKEVGDLGVDLLVSDSTNVFNEHASGSEGSLVDSFRLIFSQSNNAIFATMFASNIARMHSLALVAKECGRKVILLGGALLRALDAARSVGYLCDVDNIYPIEEMDNCKRSEVLIICTGCQGEALASMSKIVDGKIHGVDIREGDSVIFSSVIIPGNELKVCRIMNAIVAANAKLYAGKAAKIHVSGHPGQPEVKRLYELLRPKSVMPVHGEIMHMRKQIELATEWGIKSSIFVTNGDVVKVGSESSVIINKIKTGKYAIDGKFFRAPNSEVMQTRRCMMANGIVFAVILLCAETGRLLKRPSVIAPGLLDSQHDKDMVHSIVAQIEKELFSKSDIQVYAVRSVVFSIIKRACQKRMNKYPEIKVHVEKI